MDNFDGVALDSQIRHMRAVFSHYAGCRPDEISVRAPDSALDMQIGVDLTLYAPQPLGTRSVALRARRASILEKYPYARDEITIRTKARGQGDTELQKILAGTYQPDIFVYGFHDDETGDLDPSNWNAFKGSVLYPAIRRQHDTILFRELPSPGGTRFWPFRWRWPPGHAWACECGIQPMGGEAWEYAPMLDDMGEGW